jgi:hypothetical protein
MWRVVKARIYVMPEYEPHYVEQLDETHPVNWREAISIEPMPTDKLHHYGAVEVRGANEKPSPQQQAKLMALEGEYQRMLAEWEVRCAEPFAAALVELRADEEIFKSSFKLVKRRFWQFPFCNKPQPEKAHNRISFALRYGQYLVDEFNATATTIKANTAKVDALMRGAKVRSISSAIKRMQQLNAECQRLIAEGTDNLHSLRLHIPDLKADLPKLVAKSTFSLKRTINTLAIVFLFVPFLCRFSDNATVEKVCLYLWAIALIYWCLRFVWWADDLALVVTEHSDGSKEYSLERESKLKKSIFYKVFYH